MYPTNIRLALLASIMLCCAMPCASYSQITPPENADLAWWEGKFVLSLRPVAAGQAEPWRKLRLEIKNGWNQHARITGIDLYLADERREHGYHETARAPIDCPIFERELPPGTVRNFELDLEKLRLTPLDARRGPVVALDEARKIGAATLVVRVAVSIWSTYYSQGGSNSIQVVRFMPSAEKPE